MTINYAAREALSEIPEPFLERWNSSSTIQGRNWNRLLGVDPVWDSDTAVYRAIRATIAADSEAK